LSYNLERFMWSLRNQRKMRKRKIGGGTDAGTTVSVDLVVIAALLRMVRMVRL